MHISKTLVAIILVLIVVLSLSTALILGNERATEELEGKAGESNNALGCIFDNMDDTSGCVAYEEVEGDEPVMV